MPSRQSLLVVDDEQTMRDWLQAALAGRYDVRVASDGAAALAALARAPADIVLSDVRMPGRDGLALLADLQAREEPGPLVLMMTAFGTIQEAVEATKRGAFAYLTKPFSLEQLDHALGRAFEYLQLREENRSLRRNVRTRREHWGLLGSSAAMHDLREKIAMIADARGTVLLQGESGTGKEVAARAIHLAGGRRNSAVHPHQLRGDSGDPAGIRTVRLRAGRVHRRGPGPQGQVRTGRRRHPAAGRDQRDAVRDAGQAAARAPGTRVRAAGRQVRHQDRRAHHRDHEPEPARGDPGKTFPRGPLLPPERHSAVFGAAARAPRGHSAAGPALRARGSAPRTASRSWPSPKRPWPA